MLHISGTFVCDMWNPTAFINIILNAGILLSNMTMLGIPDAFCEHLKTMDIFNTYQSILAHSDIHKMHIETLPSKCQQSIADIHFNNCQIKAAVQSKD